MAESVSVRDFVLLGYRAFDGAIRGKTMLQKRMYFLSVFLNVDLGYGPHYYGPYSSAVATANTELKTLGLLQEFSTSWGVDHRGFEMARYDYFLSEIGRHLAESATARYPEVSEGIQRTAKIIEQAGDLNYMELSIAAKAFFALRRLQGSATLEQIEELLPKFGWNVSHEELEKATSFLAKAGLVSRRASSGAA